MARKVQGSVTSSDRGQPLANLAVEVLALPDGVDGAAALAAAERIGGGRTRADGTFAVDIGDRPAGARAPRRLVTAVFLDDNDSGSDRRKPLAVTRPRAESDGDDDVTLRVPSSRLEEEGLDRTRLRGARAVPRGDLAAGALRLRDQTTKAVREATSPEIKRRLDQRRKGRALATTWLGGKPRTANLTRKRFVPAGAASAKTLDGARRAGVERLGSIAVPGMRLHLDDDMLQRVLPDGVRPTPTPLKPGAIEQLKPLLPSATTASRWRTLLTTCEAERDAAAALEALDGSTPAAAAAALVAASAGLAATSDDARGALRQALQAILTNRTHPATSARPNAAAIAQSLGVELPAGPADTTAYYDFHRLQIAWEDTWTAVVDGVTEAQITDLYESIVETVDPKAVRIDDSEIEELEQFLQTVSDAITVSTSTPGIAAPSDLVAWIPALADKWTALSSDQQEWIRFLHWADGLYDKYHMGFMPSLPLAYYEPDPSWPPEWTLSITIHDLTEDWGRTQALELLAGIDVEDAPPPSGLARIERLLGGLNERLAEPYRFDVFVPGSYNYGLMTIYRQEWKPLTYQAGDLVASIPLAPGETRSFETRRVIKTSRAQKEIENSMASRSGESTTVGRSEAEIAQKASNSTNFAMSGEGSVNFLVANLTAGSQFAANQASDSAQTKKELREATEKAAQEYRDERTLEVATEESTTGETIEKRTIANPNNELTVTYLFYELQRRFEVAERLHSIVPVVLIAFEVPAPDQIDESWLVAHEWILRRVILHDRFVPALDYLTEAFAGDELGVEIRRVQWEAQLAVVAQMGESVGASSRLRDAAREALSEATETVADRDGLIKNLGEALFPSGPEDATVQAAQREAAQHALEWADADFTAAQSRLEAAVTALRQATDDYAQAIQKRTNRRVAIDQLRLHVKENILYYMQAIWSHEPPDQRYFRLYDADVQWPARDESGLTLLARPVVRQATAARSRTALPRVFEHELQAAAGSMVELHFPAPRLGPERPLHQIANLDSLLGFKGNYAIFPLKEDNAITDYMGQAFLDDYFGVVDPDPLGEMPTTSEAIALAECAWNKADTTDADRAEITRWLMDVMAAQKQIAEEIVVPTGQLFIEALPGAHPLLEDFKLAHRAIDLDRAVIGADVQRVELLRRAARLLADDLSDAEVDQRIEITGAPPAIEIDATPPPPPAETD
jgi:hypothetical protein